MRLLQPESLPSKRRQTQLQTVLDNYNSGIHVVAVQLQDVSPPKEVIGVFKDVASAKEDKKQNDNQAEGYRNDVIPKVKRRSRSNDS